MRIKHLILPVSLLFLSCDNSVVSRTEYDEVLSHVKELETENDSLQSELSFFTDYVDCLEEDNEELTEELRRTPCD